MMIVPAYGPQPSRVLIVGEAPGAEEARQGRPFIGKSGRELAGYLARHGVHDLPHWRLTNVVGEYREKNPDPTAQQIAEWTPRLYAELTATQPDLIVAVGRFAAQWFLGDSATMRTCHGMPHRAGAFDHRRADRGGPRNAIVIPTLHPAAGFYNNDVRATIHWDFGQVAHAFKQIAAKRAIAIAEDQHAGIEQYHDVDGDAFRTILAPAWHHRDEPIALDTEGSVQNPWSVQISVQPGVAYTLRCSQPDFAVGAAAIQEAANRGCLMVGHNWMHDLDVLRAMGVNLSIPGIRLWDTMYAAFLMRLEPKGLKALAWRWCGMRMTSYSETLRPAADDKQLAYLGEILAHEFPKPEPYVEFKNDGMMKVKTPKPIHGRVKKFLLDYVMLPRDDEDEADEEADNKKQFTSFLVKRWNGVHDSLREQVEAKLGPFPFPTMDDIPLDRAVRYASRDPDATLRLYYQLEAQINNLDLADLQQHGMDVLPVFEEMQSTGMPASRRAFEKLRDKMTARMDVLRVKIEREYYGGRFNPKSTRQSIGLLNRRGLQSAKKTKKGVPSTGKPGIEHLRDQDDAINTLMLWREHQHTRDMFCRPTLALMPRDTDLCVVRPELKITGTTTRRLASSEPNLLAMPKHSEFGKMVRGCYQCPPGDIFVECDLSQIESRWLAHESNDPLLVKMFKEGRDIHTETAAVLFGCPLDQVTKLQRFFAKKVNFGIPYGVGGEGLFTQLRQMKITTWDADECSRFIREWAKLYKVADRYMRGVEAQVAKTGMVRDCWGMIRYLPGVWSDDKKMASEARRQAVNHKIQGGAQGWLQRAIVYLRPIFYELQQVGWPLRWSLTIHDSVLLWIGEEIYDDVVDITLDALMHRTGMTLRVPVLAEASRATNWGEL